MKKIILFTIFGLLFLKSNAQTATVEKSIYGLQTGVLGIWAHNEIKLTNQIALRTEVGLSGGVFGGSFYPKTGFLMVPVFTAEPRWYYNLKKRVSKSRNISGNSGNFLTIQTSFYPNWFVISNVSNLKTNNLLTVIPTWGIRRNIGNHFTYETGIGLGFARQFNQNPGDITKAIANLHIRIGYQF